MNPRERIETILKGEIPDKVGTHEEFWEETLELWTEQGMPKGANPNEYLNLDMVNLQFVNSSLGLPEEVVEENEDYKIYWDSNGVLRKDQKYGVGWTPHWLDYRIKTPSDWEKVRDYMIPEKSRVNWDEGFREYKRHNLSNRFILLGIAGIFDGVWRILGQVNTFTLMMDDPDFIRDIMKAVTDMTLGTIDIIYSSGIKFDAVLLGEDMGYRNGTLFSPQSYKELIMPYHEKFFGSIHDMGLPVTMHSCGKIESLIPYLIEARLDGIQPLEAKAGQDIRELKKLYGDKITLWGNMDVRKLSGSKEDIEDEILNKLRIVIEGGRYIFQSDHSLPPTVGLDNYRYALELVDKYGRY